jgi:flagellar biosynthetic protein FlhB
MAESNQQERSQAATPRRRERAREEGQVARSREAVAAAIFLGGLFFFGLTGTTLARQMAALTTDTFVTLDAIDMSLPGLHLLLSQYVSRTAVMLLPLLITVFVVALALNVVQTGFLVSLKALQPKWSRISPLQGLRRVFSAQSVHELLKSLLKVGIVGYIVYATIDGELERLFALSGYGVADIAAYVSTSILRLATRTAYVIIALAILDYVFQRWQYEKSLRMTMQEVKDERKQQEGDPQVKARVRSIMREMARRRMMEEVPKADVIITNPTHLAVAIQYERDTMPAPKVLAKGAGYVAERIKAIAQEHRIPLVENKPIAQQLFKTVEIGEHIPEALYQAVAEILAYVYRIRSPRPTGAGR